MEMGVGMRITKVYGDQLVDGIFNLMKKMGIWTGKASAVREPIISKNPEDVSYLNAKVSGIFLPSVKHWEELKKGEQIGLERGETAVTNLVKKLMDANRIDDLKRITSDTEYRRKLMREMGEDIREA